MGGVVVLRVFVLGTYQLASDSMAPTLRSGQNVVVDKALWRVTGLDRGDLVTFAAPDSGERVLKRVVGVGGDVVRIDDAVLSVNGTPVDEPYVDLSRIDALYYGPVTVPEGSVFVLGDNRFGSIDSRVFGPVPLDAVDGRIVLTL